MSWFNRLVFEKCCLEEKTELFRGIFVILILLKCENMLTNGFASSRRSKWTYGSRCSDDGWIYYDFLKIMCLSWRWKWLLTLSEFEFLCLNRWVVKIFCLWICVRLTEPDALVCNVNTKETLSKIRQIHSILFSSGFEKRFQNG